MTEKAYWIGSVGPFIYQDDKPVNDPDLLFDGLAAPNADPLITTGQLNVLQDATLPGHVLRLKDVGDAAGDIVGPASSTDNAIARFEGTDGKLLQDSAVTIDDSGNIATTGTTITLATKTPASAAASGDKGMIAWDSGYLYVCVDTDTWKRAELITW